MQALTEFFERTGAFHILVIGDVMLDRYIRGKVDRISPEAPVPVLLWQSTEDRLGGAANVALNVKRLGARVSLAGMVGDDRSGHTMRRILEAEGIAHPHLLTTPMATTVKTRVIGGHQHLLRIDEEETGEISEVLAQELISRLSADFTRDLPDAIILQDYNKGFLTRHMIDAIFALAKAYDVPVAVDPKDANFFAFRGAAIFKPNLRELRAKVPFPVDVTPEALIRASEEINASLKSTLTAVTLSEHGIYLSLHGESGCYPTRVRTVVDVCGAGDAVISVITLAYLMNVSQKQMAELANTAGGVVCGEVGVCPVNVDKMRAELKV